MSHYTVELGVARSEAEADICALDLAPHVTVAVIVIGWLGWHWRDCEPPAVFCDDLSRELGGASAAALREAERLTVERQTQVQARLVADSCSGCPEHQEKSCEHLYYLWSGWLFAIGGPN